MPRPDGEGLSSPAIALSGRAVKTHTGSAIPVGKFASKNLVSTAWPQLTTLAGSFDPVGAQGPGD